MSGPSVFICLNFFHFFSFFFYKIPSKIWAMGGGAEATGGGRAGHRGGGRGGREGMGGWGRILARRMTNLQFYIDSSIVGSVRSLSSISPIRKFLFCSLASNFYKWPS